MREPPQLVPIVRIEPALRRFEVAHSKNLRTIATSSLKVCCGSTASR
jgi:hypothetical protein